jgi:aryl-alcohol dehydrogenase-like predicted oxidoreductase
MRQRTSKGSKGIVALPTRPLGRSGLNITRLGFGSWAIGGGDGAFEWGPHDDQRSLATMRKAIEAGINWIDTAAIDGLDHSEKVVGQFLRQMPAAERPLVFTKCGRLWDPRNRMAPERQVLKPESIRKECESSLRRLGIERIDLYTFHWPDETGTRVEDSWAAMLRLVEEGKIRAAGVSNFDVRLLDRCEAVGRVTSLQPPFSLINRAAAAHELPWCERHGTAVICYSPMQSGLLTESFTADRVSSLAENDWRRRAPEFQQPSLGRNLALRDALRRIGQRHDTSVSALAVAWVLTWPGVTGAIVGARTPAQVDGWINAASITLAPEDLDEIAAATRQTGAGWGPLASGQPLSPPPTAARG